MSIGMFYHLHVHTKPIFTLLKFYHSAKKLENNLSFVFS